MINYNNLDCNVTEIYLLISNKSIVFKCIVKCYAIVVNLQL